MANQDYYLTRDEALKFVRKSYRPGITHFVRGGAFLYTQLPNEEGSARGYDMSCLVEVSQKAAFKYIEDMISKTFDERGVRLRINLTEPYSNGRGGCIFIG